MTRDQWSALLNKQRNELGDYLHTWSGDTAGRVGFDVCRAHLMDLIEALEKHHAIWSEEHEGERVCLSECELTCRALENLRASLEEK